MNKEKDALTDQVPEYGLEAYVSTIDEYKALIAALKEASERFSILRRQLNRNTS